MPASKTGIWGISWGKQHLFYTPFSERACNKLCGRNSGGDPNIMLDLPTWQVQLKPLKFPIPTQWPVANLHDNALCNCRKPVQYHSGTGSLGAVYSHQHQWQNLSLPCALFLQKHGCNCKVLSLSFMGKICWSKRITWEEQKKRDWAWLIAVMITLHRLKDSFSNCLLCMRRQNCLPSVRLLLSLLFLISCLR